MKRKKYEWQPTVTTTLVSTTESEWQPTVTTTLVSTTESVSTAMSNYDNKLYPCLSRDGRLRFYFSRKRTLWPVWIVIPFNRVMCLLTGHWWLDEDPDSDGSIPCCDCSARRRP